MFGEEKKGLDPSMTQESTDTLDTSVMPENPYGYNPGVPPMPPMPPMGQNDGTYINEYGEVVRMDPQIPPMPPMPPMDQSDDYYINEYGEVVRREGRSR